MGGWKTYEEVAAFIIENFKEEFHLIAVEGRQKLVGKETGTEWEVDAKGISEEDGGIVIIEARRATTSKQSQEKLAALAYKIQDTGASRGIIVSHLGIQKGAEKVARANDIISVQLDKDSTPKVLVLISSIVSL